jgi:hypothetical protein
MAWIKSPRFQLVSGAFAHSATCLTLAMSVGFAEGLGGLKARIIMATSSQR